MAKFFDRNSTKLTISEFYDNYVSKKYDFEAKFQRKSNVWAEDKKSFLIDSIMKNYPIPAIFMRPIVDENGKTKYDIIDGKQRLQSIIGFIEGRILLTSYFAEDKFLDEDEEGRKIAEFIAGKSFEEIKKEKQASDSIKQFWTYTLQIEYLYEDDEELVSSVFDRLNRNGEPLNSQELRNAKYSNTALIKMVHQLAENPYLKDKFERLKNERMEDEEFISELFFLVLDGRILDSTQTTLDLKYEQYKEENDLLAEGEKKFNRIVEIMDALQLDYEGNKRLYWTTHLYTVFSLCWWCAIKNIKIEDIKKSVSDFYKEYFSKNTNYDDYLKSYKDAASSRTRSATQRTKRLEALLGYCGIIM